MSIKTICACAAATIVMFVSLSCEQETCPENTGLEMSFIASHVDDGSEDFTRTVIGDNGAVLWNVADEVSVFLGKGSNGGSKFTSQNTEPAKTVEFKGYLEGLGSLQPGQYYWAIYPYSSGNSCDGNSVTATLPAEQIAVKGSFGKNCHPAMARSTDTGLAFYAICGGVEFTVTRPGVRSVTIKGNNGESLAGTYQAFFGTDGKPTIQIAEPQAEVTLIAPNGSAFIPGEHYAISILPTSLSNGVTITLITDDNKKGTVVSNKQQNIKRSTFGRISNLNEKVASWEDIPATTEGGGTRTGLYVGIIGFNQELYKMGIERLDDSSKSRFDSFINELTPKNGTLLYHSVDEAIRTLQKAQYPQDLFSVSLITFTDGLDQGSSMIIDNYPGDGEYLDILQNRLSSSSVAGLPLAAYSVGLKGDDVSNVPLFRSNLKKLAYPESNAYEVSDMSSVNARFQEVAEQVNKAYSSTKYNIKLTIPGQANGTRMRFTLDGVSNANNSSMYIEGIFNLSSKSLTDVTYHGMTCSSGGTVEGEVSGIFVCYSFAEILPDNNGTISQGNIKHWIYSTSTSSWQQNSEFDSDNDVDVKLTKTKKTAVVLLNLDCSKSLGSQFSTLQSYAKSFIAKLYDAAVDLTEVAGVSLDKTELKLYEGNTAYLAATVTPSTASDKSVVWSSSDASVASVDQDGIVTAIKEGTTSITVTTVDGGYHAECFVCVVQIPELEAVDLGLSVKWASWNVGASTPEEYGDYFAWGETQPKNSYHWFNYQWCLANNYKLTKYCTQSNDWGSSKTMDNKTTLDPEDDAAHVNWGGSWRMPTDREWMELIEKCTWTWTTQNGVNGRLVSSKTNSNSIFLPAACYRYDGTHLYNAGVEGFYWSSSLYTDTPFYAWSVDFGSDNVCMDDSNRYDGLSVRPVWTSISLDKNELKICEGMTGTLTAIVTHYTAADKSVQWSSSDTSVATVDQDGKVTGVKSGTAVITVTTVDGGYQATCSVSVLPALTEIGKTFEAVDLGLSVKWASFNIGAIKPEEYGDYFAWGETETKSICSWSTYKFELGTDYNGPFSKYVTKSYYGTVDNKTVLDYEDDAASVNLGGYWRMPTESEWTELRENCNWIWTNNYNGTGVAGMIVTSNKTGYIDKSLFLPAAGSQYATNTSVSGTDGAYWSSSLSTGDSCYARCVSFNYISITNYYGVYVESHYRYSGHSVRPVTE